MIYYQCVPLPSFPFTPSRSPPLIDFPSSSRNKFSRSLQSFLWQGDWINGLLAFSSFLKMVFSSSFPCFLLFSLLFIQSNTGHLINKIIKHSVLSKQYLVNLKQLVFPSSLPSFPLPPPSSLLLHLPLSILHSLLFALLIDSSQKTSECKGNEPELFKTPIQLRSEKTPCLPAHLEIVEPKLVRLASFLFQNH